MDEQLASVYGLKDRRNDEFFYIGMSADPYARYGEHIMIRTAKNAKESRILDMRKDGILPELVIFEKDIPRLSAFKQEAYWIRYFQDLGISLTNCMQNRKHLKDKLEEWIPPYKAFKLFEPYGSNSMPECVQRFALKRSIRRKQDPDKKSAMLYHRCDILAYRDSLRQQGKLLSHVGTKGLTV